MKHHPPPNLTQITYRLVVFLLFLLVLDGCAALAPAEPALVKTSLAEYHTTQSASPPTSSPIPLPTMTRKPPATTQAETAIPTAAPLPTSTQPLFEVGLEITVDYLQNIEISGSAISYHEELPPNNRYERHIVSYLSEGNQIYGLLTTPLGDPPPDGYPAIVFNHGYIPPANYRTTERYEAYVDYLARSGFVVFKIDFRGHGQSEGQPSGAYFSPGYTIDAIAALKSLQTLAFIDPGGIGMWGHSMAGNVVLRAMLIEPDIQAGVIWSGAVYSYDDFAKYGISDNTYRPPPTPEDPEAAERRRERQEIFDTYGRPGSGSEYWQEVSLTAHLDALNQPLQIHHAEDDPVVNIGYSRDLAKALEEHQKEHQFYSYHGGGHNIVSPYFDTAMQRTVQFFRENL